MPQNGNISNVIPFPKKEKTEKFNDEMCNNCRYKLKLLYIVAALIDLPKDKTPR